MSSGKDHIARPQMACIYAAVIFSVFALAQRLLSPQYSSLGVLMVDAVVLGTMSVFFMAGKPFLCPLVVRRSLVVNETE